MKSKFRNNQGLTQYAFMCGYVQTVKKFDDLAPKIELYLEGVYHVKTFNNNCRESWDCFESLTEARKFWTSKVNHYYGEQLAAIRSDNRYVVELEYSGESEPSFVARFEPRMPNSFIGKSNTKEGAMLLAYDHKQQSLIK